MDSFELLNKKRIRTFKKSESSIYLIVLNVIGNGQGEKDEKCVVWMEGSNRRLGNSNKL